MSQKSIKAVINKLLEDALEQIQEGYPEIAETTIEDALEFLEQHEATD